MNKQAIKTVKVSATGVQFGNAWFSHEAITGYSADLLNAGTCGVTGGAYMAWLSAESPADSVEGCYEHALKAMEGEADRLRAATIQTYDEAKERELFESASEVSDGIYWSKDCEAYRSINGRSVERSDATDATLRLQGWLACAKSRAGIHP